MTTAAEESPETSIIDETVAFEARVYRDQQGGLWLDPFGDGNLFPFDRQCRTLMTEKWGTTPMDLVAAQFELAELVPALERPTDWGIRYRLQAHMSWTAVRGFVSKTVAVDQRDRLRDAGFEAELWSRPGTIGPGDWQNAEDQA